MKIIGTPSSKIDAFSSDDYIDFSKQFNNKKRKVKKRKRFTLRPSRKSVKLEKKLFSTNLYTNDPYVEIEKEIDNLHRINNLNTVMKNNGDNHFQGQINITLNEQIRINEDFEKKNN